MEDITLNSGSVNKINEGEVPSASYRKISEILLSNDWSLEFCEIFRSSLMNSEGEFLAPIKKKLWPFIENDFNQDFRIQIQLGGQEFLLAVFGKRKILRLAHPALRIEMFKLSEKQDDEEFKNYVEEILSIDLQKMPTAIELATKIHRLPDLMTKTEIEERRHMAAEKLSEVLREKISEYRMGPLEKLSDFGLNLTARYALIRIHILRFFALLPGLDLYHIKPIFLQTLRRLKADSKSAAKKKIKGQNSPLPGPYIRIIEFQSFVTALLPHRFFGLLVRWKVRQLAKRFIAGESIETAHKVLNTLTNSQRDATLDQLGELVVSQEEADQYMNRVIELIKGMSQHFTPGSKNRAGILKAHVSIKVSALNEDFRAHAFSSVYEKIAPRLKNILITAKEHHVFVNIDAEHYHVRDLVFKIYSNVLLETPELADYQDTGIVIQAYLRDAQKHFNEVLELAKIRNLMMPIRLVKGAYWDAETIEAEVHDYIPPQWLNKEESDIHMRQLIHLTFDSFPYLQLCLAGHNIGDHCYAQTLRNEKYSNIPEIEHQCLHMTYEGLSTAMAKMGWCVRNYVPIGNLLVGMAYLVRRIMENSSQVGFLTIMRTHKKMKGLPKSQDALKEKQNKGRVHFDLNLQALEAVFKNVTPMHLYKNDQLQHLLEAKSNFEKKYLGAFWTNEASSGVKKVITCNSDYSIRLGLSTSQQ